MEKNIFRKELASFRPYVPGKSIDEVQKEYGLQRIVKLASNENPLGPSHMAIEEIRKQLETIHLYPDPASASLRGKLSEQLDMPLDQIVVGNGGEQILLLVAQTFINEGDEAIMANVTFDMYASSVSFLGGVPVRVPLKEYKHDFEEFITRITEKTKLIYVCNPNNPTGNIMTSEDIKYLVERIPDDIVLILDEAYYDYATVNPDYPKSMEILKHRDNTIILRTFSKVAGIAGVRIGYAITSKKIAESMTKIKPTFNVNRLAQAAAIGAIDDLDHIKKTVELNYKSMAIMEDYFAEKGLKYIKSNANFILIDIGIDSRIIFEELMKRGIIIRPGYNWGFDTWIRVSTGTLEQTKFFTEQLDEVIKQESC